MSLSKRPPRNRLPLCADVDTVDGTGRRAQSRVEEWLSWCDTLAATPSVGFKLDQYDTSTASIFDALRPMVGRWRDGDDPAYVIERQDANSLILQTQDGFQYGIEPARAFVTFQHRVKIRNQSGGPPTMELMSKVVPFTQLLPEVSERLIETVCLLPGAASRKVTRMGIVSRASVARADLPPGIEMLVAHAGKPWKGRLDGMHYSVTAVVGETTKATDRCIHTVAIPVDPDELVGLTFDWHREFSNGMPCTRAALRAGFDQCKSPALEYLEEIGRGDRFDAEPIVKDR